MIGCGRFRSERYWANVQALAWQGGDRVEVVDREPPQPGAGWAVVDVAYAGVCGTDLHICRGEHPRAQPGLVLGHEIAGRLRESAAGLPAGTAVMVNPLLSCQECRSCRNGAAHVCDRLRLLGIDAPGGAAEYVAVPDSRLVPLPSGLDLRVAALIEPLAVAVRAVRRGGLRLGHRAHVIGAGPVGLLVANCARLAGAAEVTMSEPARQRAEVAAGFGFTVLAEPDRRADVVFDCTGHPAVAPAVLGWAATSATVVTVGAYPGVAGVDLQSVMLRELAIVGTRVYTPEDVEAAVGLARRDPFGLDRLVTSVIGVSDGPRAIARLASGAELKVLIEGPAAG
jgi:(R,R)-butanediol dehydrogenase / meso-butanediol dehydrogenase / diacetyl reductase